MLAIAIWQAKLMLTLSAAIASKPAPTGLHILSFNELYQSIQSKNQLNK
ncbi:hypothetical protein [Pseudomonas sp. S2_H10]